MTVNSYLNRVTGGLKKKIRRATGNAPSPANIAAHPVAQSIHAKQLSANPDIRERYLDLMIGTLAGTIYEDVGLGVMGGGKYDPNLREHGWDWPSKAVTMVGTKRLRNLRTALESVIQSNIKGDFVETGVWRGGASILARAVLAAHNVKDRKIIVCDSFEGLPKPDPEKYPADKGSDFYTYAELAISLEEVKTNFAKFNLLDEQVVFLKGWFKDTMKDVPSKEIAVLRLDGDMYESTIDPLIHLFDRVPNGGWIIIDDYEVVPAAKQAVHDFLDSKNLKVDMNPIDGVGVYFRKD
jgi:O-methyltransferase